MAALARLGALIWISLSGKCSKIPLLPQTRWNCSPRELWLPLLPELRAESASKGNRDGRGRNRVGAAGNRSKFPLRTSPPVWLARVKWCSGLLQALCIREDFRGTEWLLCAQPATTDAPTLSELPQARTLRKPFTKLCLAFRRLALALRHQSNAPQLVGDSCKKEKKQLQKSQTSFPRKSGVFQGVSLWHSQAVCVGGPSLIPGSLQSSTAFPVLLLRRVLGAHLAQFYRMMMTMCFS